jgi:nucleoside-diphosphate-sugar epimerase
VQETNTNSKSVLIVGCGDLGIRAGRELFARGWQVAGVRRDVSRLPAEFTAFAADYTRSGSLDFAQALRPEFVVATFNPLDRSEAGYRAGFTEATANLLRGLGGHVPRIVISVSSTRVFAERRGGWVDEESPLAEDDPLALAMIDAEHLLLSSPLPATVVRFAGIYGAPGGRLVSRVARGEICEAQPPRYGNRIHRDDCAGFLCHLLGLASAGEPVAPVYIGVDDDPAPQYEVEQWLAGELGVEGRPGTAPGRGGSGHKRCRNRLLRASGYELRYPDFRAGYGVVLRATGRE